MLGAIAAEAQATEAEPFPRSHCNVESLARQAESAARPRTWCPSLLQFGGLQWKSTVERELGRNSENLNTYLKRNSNWDTY